MNVTSAHAPVILRHLADPAIRALIVAAVAAMSLRLMRVKQTSIRLGIWTGVLYAALAMPLLGTLLPPLPLRLPVTNALDTPRQSPSFSTASPVTSPASGALPLDRFRAAVAHRATSTRHPLSWPLVALAAYGLIASLLLARLALGLWLAARLAHDARPIHDPAVEVTLQMKARALGLKRSARIAQSRAVAVPLTVGVLDPVILLPVDWPDWEKNKLAAVVAHELAHVKRRDCLTRVVSRIYQCLFWFSPLGWWLDGHLAELAEQASDQDAIGAGADPVHYAEVLMSFFAVIHKMRGRVRLHGISMAHGRRGGARIDNVLSMPAGMATRLPRSSLVLIVAGAAATVFVVAALQPRSASAALPEIQSAKQQAAPPAQAAPPEATSEGDSADGRNTWTFNTSHGMDFAIVSGRAIMVNGSEDDRDEVESLRTKLHRDFIWFIHGGNSYVIRDAAVVSEARRLYAPVEALGRQQEALGKKQEALGEQQEKLGEKMEAVKVGVPSDLQAQLKSLESTVQYLGSTGSQRQLADLQEQIAHLQSEIGDVQSSAGHAQEVIGRQQGELGRMQGRLGRQQGDLGRQQGRLARQASSKMQTILEQSLSNGLAQRATPQ